MIVKSNFTIKEFGVFSKGIILYIKIEAENDKMHRLGQKKTGDNFNGWAKWSLLK